jgi:hypothetical protein
MNDKCLILVKKIKNRHNRQNLNSFTFTESLYIIITSFPDYEFSLVAQSNCILLQISFSQTLNLRIRTQTNLMLVPVSPTLWFSQLQHKQV